MDFMEPDDPYMTIATGGWSTSDDPYMAVALGQDKKESNWGVKGVDEPQWGDAPKKPYKAPKRYPTPIPGDGDGFDETDAETLAKYGVGTKGAPKLTGASAVIPAFIARHSGPGTFLGDASDTTMGKMMTGLTDLPVGFAQAVARLIGRGEEADALVKLREGLIQANQNSRTQFKPLPVVGDPARFAGSLATPIPGVGASKGVAGFAKAAGIGGALGFMQPNPNVQYDDQGGNDYVTSALKGGAQGAAFNTLIHGGTRYVANKVAGKTVTPAPGDVRNLGSDLETKVSKAFQDDADFVAKMAADDGTPWAGKAKAIQDKMPGAVGNEPAMLSISTEIQQLKDKVVKDQAYAARNQARGNMGAVPMPRAVAAVQEAIVNASQDMTGKADGKIATLRKLEAGLKGEDDVTRFFDPKALPENPTPEDIVRFLDPKALPEPPAGSGYGYTGESVPPGPARLEATRTPTTGNAAYDPVYNPAPEMPQARLEATRTPVTGRPAYDQVYNPSPVGPDISKVDRTLSVLKANIRKIYSGGNELTGDLGVDDAQKIVNAMGDDANLAYRKLGGDAARLADEANATNAAYKRKWANPTLRRTISEQAPDTLPGVLFGNSADSAALLKEGMTPLGHEAAQSLMLKRVMSESGGDPSKIVSSLKKIKGATSVFFEGDSKAKLDGLEKIARVSKNVGNIGGPLAATAIGGEFAGASGAFLGLLGSGRYAEKLSIPGATSKVTQWLLSTEPGQKWLLKVGKQNPDSATLSQWMSQIASEAGLASGAAARPPWEKPQDEQQ